MLINKHNGRSFDGTRQCCISGGGGGGSSPAPAPSSQTVTNTSIPAYAQPYVETMLGQTSALTDINQNPYQPYGGQRIAEFSPLQQQAFSNVANQQTAGQIGTGTDLASQAGYGGLSAANQVPGLQNQALGYGQSGSMYGAAGADQAMMQSMQAQRQAQMYGRQGSQYGAQAAGLSPQAQQYGQTAADVGMGGLGYGIQGAMAGQQAAGYGSQGANIGQNVANMSTNPYAQQAYMSPYIQNALQPQLQEMTRQYDITGAQEKGRATAAGAFGGTRNSLMQAENERNKNMAMNQAIGSGYQNAFTAAQNQMNQAATLGMQGTQQGIAGQQAAMQGAGVGLSGLGTAMQGQQAGLAGLSQAGSLYGQGMQGAQTGLSGVGQQLASGQLGLSGAQTGMQGAQSGLAGVQGAVGAGQYGLAGLGTAGAAAGTLGQLGQTQFGQQQAINQSQATAGAVQQAQAQQALDLGYQDFNSQKNYPYQQLAFMSDMLRGLPLSQSAQSQYTAPPNTASQLGGLGMSALGIYGMSGGFKKANGGMVGKGHANGGLMSIQSYKDGGQIGYAAGGDISMLNIPQLQKLLQNKSLNRLEAAAIEDRIRLLSRMQNNPEAAQIMSHADQRFGIGAIGTGDMVPEEVPAGAGGGIIAFAAGGAKKPDQMQSYQDMLRETVKKRLLAQESGSDPFAESKVAEAQMRGELDNIRKYSPFEALAMAGLGTMAGTSQYGLTNLGLGGIEGLKSYAKSKAEQDAIQKTLLTQGVEREKSKYARDTANLNSLQTELGRMDTKEIGLLNARNTAGATASAKQTTALIQAQNSYNQALDNAKDILLKQTKFASLYRNDPAAFNRAAKAEAVASMSPQVLEILGMKAVADSPVVPEAPVGKKSEPVIVTIPASGGKPARQIQFGSKEKADAFKKEAGIK
jgi:hypothetical protein